MLRLSVKWLCWSEGEVGVWFRWKDEKFFWIMRCGEDVRWFVKLIGGL